MRDFLYAPNMQGVDWPKGRALLRAAAALRQSPRRPDLHHRRTDRRIEPRATPTSAAASIRSPQRILLGLLGAKLERDPASGYFRIARILKGENWDPKLRSPLTEIGVNVKQGDYILAIDGKPTNQMKNIYAALVDTVGKQVTLRVNARAADRGKPRNGGRAHRRRAPLYYLNWVLGNIDRVSKATDGKVAYVHIPDMGPEGMNEFTKLLLSRRPASRG